jgi:uncharacterized membrane protein YccF (DUF307 family)
MNNIKRFITIYIGDFLLAIGVILFTLITVLLIETILLPFTISNFIKKVYGKINQRIRR